MSDTQDNHSSSSEVSGIVQQLHNLVDVEAGLAEAHLAVENQAASADVDPNANADEILLDDEPAAGAVNESEPFLAEAEKVEGALESAIPPAPSQTVQTVPITAAESSIPGLGNDPRLHQTAAASTSHVSQAASEAQQTINSVNADILVPVLPEQVAEPAHDVVMETTIEEETSPMQVDEEEEEVRPRYDPSEPQEPISYDPSEPQTLEDSAPVRYDPSEPQGQAHEPAPVRYDPSEPQDATPVSYDPSVPQQSVSNEQTDDQTTPRETSQPREASSVAAAIDSPTADVKPTTGADPRLHQLPPKPEVSTKSEIPSYSTNDLPVSDPLPGRPLSDLPDNITDQSPSVVANKDMTNRWRANTNDTQALLRLFGWSLDNTEVNDARAWYAVIAKYSPSAPLLSLVKLEQALNNFTEVENLFARAIKGPSGGITATADVNVWKQYLQYIRRQNPVVEGAGISDPTRNTIISAYEFALKECGTDRASGDIWQDYLQFLSAPRPTNEWEEQQKQDSLRKTYHKAVCIPLDNVEILWKAYDAFENNVNKQTAKKFLAERSPAYMTARTALKDLHRLTDPLYAAQAILPPKPTFSGPGRGLINGWKAYLQWEQDNKLVIEDKDALAARVRYALKQCMGQMRHFPELWHYVSIYYADAGNIEEATTVLRAGIVACPNSVLLTFACADMLESQKDLTTCHEIYEALITNLTSEVEDLHKTVAAEVEIARGPDIPNAPQTTDDEIQMSDQMSRLVQERDNRGKMVEERRGKEVKDIENAISITWVMYMRCTRRSEGIKAARSIFGRARRTSHLSWHIFEASAMMEFHSNKDAAVAIKIFDLGAKKFPNEVEYVIRHLQFLLSINDDTNARALFERSALNIPAEKARPLWDAWARYEYMYGDLAAVNKLEARFAEAFPRDSPLKRLAQRFTYNGVDQIGIRELGLGRQIAHPHPMPPPQPTLPIPFNNGPGPGPAPGPSFPPPNNNNYSQPQNQNRPPSPRGRSPPPVRRNRSPSFTNGQPGNKRYRPSPSYNPPPPRDDVRDKPVNRYPSGTGGAPPPPPPFVPPPRASLPPRASPAPVQGEPSGLAPALPWFIGQLPSNRSYDGPVIQADDIMRLFDNVSRDGLAMHPVAPPARGYPPPAPVPAPVYGARQQGYGYGR